MFPFLGQVRSAGCSLRPSGAEGVRGATRMPPPARSCRCRVRAAAGRGLRCSPGRRARGTDAPGAPSAPRRGRGGSWVMRAEARRHPARPRAALTLIPPPHPPAPLPHAPGTPTRGLSAEPAPAKGAELRQRHLAADPGLEARGPGPERPAAIAENKQRSANHITW